MEHNDGYSPSDWIGVKRFDIVGGGGATSVGLTSWRQPSGGVGGPGTYHTATFRYNRVLYYTDPGTGPVKSLSWHPNTGSDSLIPNHGAVAGGADSFPQDWFTNIQMDAWDSGAGDTEVRNVKHVLNQPAINNGVYIWYSSTNAQAGNATLTLDMDAGFMTLQLDGDTVGSNTDILIPEQPGSELFYIPSNNGEYVRVRLYTAQLPVSGVTVYTVKVTDTKLMDMQMYPGVTGEWQ